MSPAAPRRPCPGRGPRTNRCPNLIARGVRSCPECMPFEKKAKAELDRLRGGATERGYDSRWARFRRMFLSANPICACGCGRASVEIHHLTPVSGPNDPLFYEESNLVALTKQCHSRETMRMLNERRRT